MVSAGGPKRFVLEGADRPPTLSRMDVAGRFRLPLRQMIATARRIRRRHDARGSGLRNRKLLQ